MTITADQELMLARISQSHRTPEEYNAMLRALPDSVKRTFVEMDKGALREYAVRSVNRKLRDNPEMAKLVDKVSMLSIIDQVFQNVLEDQKIVRESLHGAALGGNANGLRGRVRVIRR